MNKGKAFLCPIIFGIIMIIIGVCIKVPGGALTTYSNLDGEKADNYYSFDNTYVAIDEYVGGDAYNYEIGASLVAGRTAGAMMERSVFVACGLMCLCAGITMAMLQGEKLKKAKKELNMITQENEGKTVINEIIVSTDCDKMPNNSRSDLSE